MVFSQIVIASSMAYSQEIFNMAKRYNDLGVVLASQNQYEEALECFIKADEILGGNEDVQRNIQLCRAMLK